MKMVSVYLQAVDLYYTAVVLKRKPMSLGSQSPSIFGYALCKNYSRLERLYHGISQALLGMLAFRDHSYKKFTELLLYSCL